MINLDELERLAKAATPRPWKNIIDPDFEEPDCQMITNRKINHVASFIKASNAAYIVATCNAVPELIERVRELEREVELWREIQEHEWERSRDD